MIVALAAKGGIIPSIQEAALGLLMNRWNESRLDEATRSAIENLKRAAEQYAHSYTELKGYPLIDESQICNGDEHIVAEGIGNTTIQRDVSCMKGGIIVRRNGKIVGRARSLYSIASDVPGVNILDVMDVKYALEIRLLRKVAGEIEKEIKRMEALVHAKL